jgi:hypothetical protein
MVIGYQRLGQPLRPVLKGQEVQEYYFLDCLSFENGIDRLSRNVGKRLPFSDV